MQESVFCLAGYLNSNVAFTAASVLTRSHLISSFMAGTWDALMESNPDMGILPDEPDPGRIDVPVTAAINGAPTPGAGRGRSFTVPAWMTGSGFCSISHYMLISASCSFSKSSLMSMHFFRPCPKNCTLANAARKQAIIWLHQLDQQLHDAIVRPDWPARFEVNLQGCTSEMETTLNPQGWAEELTLYTKLYLRNSVPASALPVAQISR